MQAYLWGVVGVELYYDGALESVLAIVTKRLGGGEYHGSF